MNKEDRIKQVKQEIEQFDYLRMKKMELAQQTQKQLQKELEDINTGILTRQGEIICLQRLIAEEKKAEEEKAEAKRAKRVKEKTKGKNR